MSGGCRKKGKIMSMKHGPLCIGLSLIVLLFSITSYETGAHSAEIAPYIGGVKESERKIENQPAPEVSKEPTTPKDHISIAERNIFNPERKDFPIAASGPGGGMRPLIRPSIILYGITIFGNSRFATITQPGRPLKKGERESMTLKLGEKIGEYRLAKIFPDRITLETEGDSFEVLLHDSSAPKRRSDTRTESKPTPLTAALPTPTPPSAGPASSSREAVQSSIESAPGRVVTPPSLPTPARPSFPAPSTRRGGRFYPSPGSSTQ
jgi:hypothetical protein